jgi:hypothetical protein
VNVLTCVEKWAKETPAVLIAYNLFCELVHPNIGSSFLVCSSDSDRLHFGKHKGEPGAVILNTGKADDKSLDRKNGAYCVGDYLSSLVFQVLLAKASKFGAPLNKKCYAVDVFREKIYTAPASFSKLNKNLVAACEMIASRWKDIKPPA